MGNLAYYIDFFFHWFHAVGGITDEFNVGKETVKYAGTIDSM